MSEAATPAVETPRLSEGQRLAYAFSAPGRLFADVKLNRSWWAPLIILIISSLAFVAAVQTKVGWEQTTENMMAARLAGRDIPAEQREAIMQRSVAGTRIGSYLAPAIILVFTAILAGVYLFAFNFGLGATHTYKYVFAAMMYAWLPPGLVRSVLATISLFAGTDPEGFMMDSPVASNLGILVNRIESPALYTLLSWIDVFTIWTVVLLGIAFTTGTKTKRATGIAVVGALYGLAALIQTGIAAL